MTQIKRVKSAMIWFWVRKSCKSNVVELDKLSKYSNILSLAKQTICEFEYQAINGKGLLLSF